MGSNGRWLARGDLPFAEDTAVHNLLDYDGLAGTENQLAPDAHI